VALRANPLESHASIRFGFALILRAIDFGCRLTRRSVSDKVVRLEELIEELAADIESCRKLILVSRVAVAAALLRSQGCSLAQSVSIPPIMAAAVAASLGGIAVRGSNGSTAREAAKELALADLDRSR
jgi:hypothetical protein